jgi:pilus assembly protein Flp/PilA
MDLHLRRIRKIYPRIWLKLSSTAVFFPDSFGRARPPYFYGWNAIFMRSLPSCRHRQGVCRMSKLIALLKNEHGATAIEYGLIAAGISIAIIAVVNGLGTQLNTTFNSVSTQLH